MNKVEICIKKILFYIIFLMAVLIIPTMFVKAESNKKSPKTIESFKIDNTKGECDFTYNLEDAADWMENITGIKKNEQTIPVSKYTISMESATITIGITLSENDKISISSEGYQDIAFVIQGEHLFNTAWKHDENTHWKECMIKDCVEKTDIAEHSGGQATCQKKAICSVCKISYGEVKKEDKAAKVATQIKKLDVKVSNLTMKKISGVQAARKAYNTLSKKEKYTIKKEVSTLTKAETLIKQNNCGANVYYRFSNNTLTIFGKGVMKNCFTKTTANMNIGNAVRVRSYQKYISKVVNIVVENGVSKIGNGAFACMPKLKTAKIQGNLGIAALWGCTNLEKVTYTNGKGTMGFACFGNCKKLRNMVIAEGVSSMNRSCFAGCTKLKTIELPTTLKVVGETSFHSCTSLRTVTVKGKVTKCKKDAFYKVKKCKIILKTKAAKKSKKVFAKELKQEGNKKVKIK